MVVPICLAGQSLARQVRCQALHLLVTPNQRPPSGLADGVPGHTPVRTLQVRPGQVLVEVDVARPGLLVVSEAYYPGLAGPGRRRGPTPSPDQPCLPRRPSGGRRAPSGDDLRAAEPAGRHDHFGPSPSDELTRPSDRSATRRRQSGLGCGQGKYQSDHGRYQHDACKDQAESQAGRYPGPGRPFSPAAPKGSPERPGRSPRRVRSGD